MGKDVVALGELLIDFTFNGTSPQENPMLEANPGGAPCNVLAMLTRLGHSTAFIGKIGNDMFGSQLENALLEVGIGTDGLVKDDVIHTTLAFVQTFPDGDRDFSFYRNPGADIMLSADEIDANLIKESKIFHLGSLSMTDEPVRTATMKALDIAKEAGVIISFDPNLREPLWNGLDEARKAIDYVLQRCDILKISDNEIQWFTGEDGFDEGVSKLYESYPNIKLMMVSMGKDGSNAYQKDAGGGLKKVTVMPFIQENTIETTGAGDTFCASILHYVLDNGLRSFSEDELREMLTFANAAASLITTRKGALRVMPYEEEVRELIRRG